MEELVITAIRALSNAKREKGIVPSYVLFSELANAISNKIKIELNALCREKKVRWQKTLNEVAFEVNDNTNPEPTDTREENNNNEENINKLLNA